MSLLFKNYKGSVVYQIINRNNGNSYIGSSNNFALRKKSHLRLLRVGRHYNYNLTKDYGLFGEDSFSFEIIEFVNDNSMLVEREQSWIDQLSPYYNIQKSTTAQWGSTKSFLIKEAPDVSCVPVKTDLSLLLKIENRTGISIEELKNILKYNILTVKQFSKITQLSVNRITAKTKMCFIGGKMYAPELDVCFPFLDMKGKGPKFVIRNEKAEKYLQA